MNQCNAYAIIAQNKWAALCWVRWRDSCNDMLACCWPKLDLSPPSIRLMTLYARLHHSSRQLTTNSHVIVNNGDKILEPITGFATGQDRMVIRACKDHILELRFELKLIKRL